MLKNALIGSHRHRGYVSGRRVPVRVKAVKATLRVGESEVADEPPRDAIGLGEA
jgi:hypothetical protein